MRLSQRRLTVIELRGGCCSRIEAMVVFPRDSPGSTCKARGCALRTAILLLFLVAEQQRRNSTAIKLRDAINVRRQLLVEDFHRSFELWIASSRIRKLERDLDVRLNAASLKTNAVDLQVPARHHKQAVVAQQERRPGDNGASGARPCCQTGPLSRVAGVPPRRRRRGE